MALVFFLATSFRFGWTRASTDFPNYYTAATLVKKRAPLRQFYDWTWFERQAILAGYEQISAYYPLTPVSAFPMLPIAGLGPQTAKRVWLSFGLLCLAITLWILSKLTRFNMSQLWLLTFLGYGALHQNFLFGQYYVFLLFLVTLSFYCLVRKHEIGAGTIAGIAFALKLYGGPIVLFLVAKRYWKATTAAAISLIVFAAVAIAWFGWQDNVYYLSQVLPRSLAGDVLDPYHSLNNTLTTLLRRSLMMEPEMNPHPLWNAPWLCFFLQPFMLLGLLAISLLAVYRSNEIKWDFAWFCLTVMLLSTSAGPYSYILLVLPLALLLDQEEQVWQKVFLVGCWIVLGFILNVSVSRFFPKVWVLLALFCVAGRRYWLLIKRREAAALLLLVAVAAAGLATLRYASYRQEPAQHWQRIVPNRGVGFEESPAVLRSGIIYQGISASRYVLEWLHAGRLDEFRFDGQALRPVALAPDGPVRFDLLAHRTSRSMLFDPNTGRSWEDRSRANSEENSARSGVSPDGKWMAVCRPEGQTNRLWLHRMGGGMVKLTGGNCSSWSPVWELDSRGIIFVSDCGRGGGWGALYRARLASQMSLLEASMARRSR